VRHRRKSLRALGAGFIAFVLVPGLVSPAGATTEKWSGLESAYQALVDRGSPADVAASAATNGTDPTGEVSHCQGDIASYGADYLGSSGSATAVFSLQTACATNPTTAPAWTVGYSLAAWLIDVNGDGGEDYIAGVMNDGNSLGAELFRTGSTLTHVCTGTPAVGEAGQRISASFPAACLGSPSSFRIMSGLQYDRYAAGDPDCGTCTFDEAPNDQWGATTALDAPPPPPPPPPPPSKRQGYWMVDRVGKVYSFGDAGHFGDVQGLAAGMEAVDLEPSPSGNGYWVVTNTGHVYAFRDAGHVGALNGSLAVGESVTSLSATPTGQGYWLFTSKGRVVPFGDAQFHGDMRNTALNGAVLDSIPTPSGHGYYMVGSDGGIFTFGDAQFFGSTGSMKLNAPVQSLVPDPDGAGYWLVASDGGIFAFDGAFYGSMGDRRLNGPVTGMVGFGNGYLMVGEDGGIFTFGEAPFFGSLGANPPAQPIVSVAILNQ
jgi:hypothetical protein